MGRSRAERLRFEKEEHPLLSPEARAGSRSSAVPWVIAYALPSIVPAQSLGGEQSEPYGHIVGPHIANHLSDTISSLE
jgi:hypothetical protein